uniref:Uncharacterized protein n=1 Tax=Salmo trutta TaxID=8032 RepID=A0A674DMH9_SALTR
MCFTEEPHFCPECGNILPLPGLQDTVNCPIHGGCGKNSPIKFLKKPAVLWTSVLRFEYHCTTEYHCMRCSRCNKEGMVYHTRQ